MNIADMINSTPLLWLLFPIAFTLHNLEEAIWLPRWSHYAQRFHKPVAPNEFIFALVILTLFGYLASLLAVLYPSTGPWKALWFGLLGVMILNVFVPHLAATIALKRYAPGLATGLLLLLPIDALILYQAIADGSLQWGELGLSTAAVAVVIIGLLPLLFRAGRAIRWASH